MSNYPDFGKEPPEYAVTLNATLAGLTDQELTDLLDPKAGLGTVCKYLPTSADIHGFLRDLKARREQFKPAPTSYRRFAPQPEPPQPPAEHRKAQVRELLGYDPSDARARKEFHNPPAPLPEDFSSAKLQTPDRPVSDELKRLLVEQGAGHLIREDRAA